jgi:ribonuclease HI
VSQHLIEIYTDGSCNTKFRIGGWAAILLFSNEKITLSGLEQNTTNNSMELTAVIKAIEFVEGKFNDAIIQIFTDSQYVHHIPERKEKLKKNQFLTKKGTPIQNSDLVKKLIHKIESRSITFIKVKAHQKSEKIGLKDHYSSPVNYNIEVDKFVRKMVRESVKRSRI